MKAAVNRTQSRRFAQFVNRLVSAKRLDGGCFSPAFPRHARLFDFCVPSVCSG